MFELTTQLQELLDREFAAGGYESPQHVLEAGVRLLRQRREQREELLGKLREAEEELARGEGTLIRSEQELDAFFDGIVQRGLARLDAREPVKNETR